MSFLVTEFQGNPVWRWLVAVGILLFVGFVFRIILRVTVRRLRAIVIKTPGRFDDLLVDLLQKTRFLFIFVISMYAAAMILTLPSWAENTLRGISIVAVLFQARYWGNAFVEFWIRRSVKIDVTALIAGLGIGGIAIALSVQNILSDLFASVSIIVDKPFVIGDFIIVGDQVGTVEKIGLKTTRIRSLTGEQIIFSNSDLLSSRVRNYKRMFERRIAFSVGVTYETTPDQLEGIPALMEEIVSSQPEVRFDRCHFKTLGDFALQIETVYYVLVPDYAVYMDVQQAINLALMRAFADREIEFAYPTQTVLVQNDSRE